MKINFEQHEITEALRQYVARRFNIAEQAFSAEFRMGKKENGLTVVVSVEDPTIPAATSTLTKGEEEVAAVTATKPEPAANTVGAVITENVKEVAAVTAQADAAPAPKAETKVEDPAPAAPEVVTDEAGIFD